MEFRVHVRSGPIIEDCTGIVFRGDYYPDAISAAHAGSDDGDGSTVENMYRDVKDFNWLRTLVPSPNFVVVTNGGEDKDEMKSQMCREDDAVGATNQSNSPYI